MILPKAFQIKWLVARGNPAPKWSEFAVIDGMGAEQESIATLLELEMAARAGTQRLQNRLGKSDLSFACYFHQHGDRIMRLTENVNG